MRTVQRYVTLGVVVGLAMRIFLPEMGGKAPGWCGDTDNWLFLPGFVAMATMGVVVSLLQHASRSRRKTPRVPLGDLVSWD